jgi:CRP/FNR family cyclic AMP-dependent transcriptional regulator
MGLLDPSDRADLMQLGRPQRFPRGAHVIVQGDHSDTVFILLEGHVKVVLTTSDGREAVLSVLSPGELLGEFETIRGGGCPREAGNVALGPIAVRVISGSEFLAFLESHPQTTLVLLRSILHRFGSADRRLINSGTLDTPHRLARFLLELADQYGQPSAGRVELDVSLAQDELASLIAASRESVVRALASLRRQGYITTGRRTISLCDIDGLRRYAG